MKNTKKRILWITETAAMLALLVAVQGVTSGFGNQILTGSCVNFILAVSVLMTGLWSGVVVAAVSPFLASLFGIGPKFIQLLPGVALGNLALVVALHLLLGQQNRPFWRNLLAGIAAPVAKFFLLFLVMGKFLIPTLVSGGVIPQKAAGALSAQFSLPQLITALIGTTLALSIVPLLRKALKRQ